MTLISQHTGALMLEIECLEPKLICLVPSLQVSPSATLPVMTNSYYLVMHALSSVETIKTPTVAFMLLPSQMGWTKKGYI
eukprot:1151689-Pelagomonas_calceolata.AAC.3